MREIKFRCWDIGKKVFIPNDVYAIITTDFKAFGVMLKDWENYREGEYFYKDSQVVMQYTGLTDKNGKEIYEGDIGRIASMSGRIELFTVEWGVHRREMKSGWTVDIPGFSFIVDGFPTFPIVDNYLNGHDLDIIEIIGNIYESPELLTK